MQSLALLLHDAARLMKSEFERRAKDHRLSLMQWRTLGVLSRDDGMTQAVLAARVEASAMTMSDILDRLESLDLVRREPDPADGRAKRVRITAQAAPIVREMHGIAAQVYARALDGIAPEDLKSLTRTLQRISANLETAEVPEKEDIA